MKSFKEIFFLFMHEFRNFIKPLFKLGTSATVLEPCNFCCIEELICTFKRFVHASETSMIHHLYACKRFELDV